MEITIGSIIEQDAALLIHKLMKPVIVMNPNISLFKLLFRTQKCKMS